MYLKNIVASCCWVLSAMTVVAQDLIPTDTSHFTPIRIDPTNAMGGNVSDVFKEVKYIPLETTPESLLGKVSQLEVINGYYVILDHDMNAIFIFTLNGKFHAKIKGRPNVKIPGFVVNKWTNQIVYTSDNYQNMTYCNLDGKVIKNKKNLISNAAPIVYIYSHFISPDQLINYDPYRDIDSSSAYYQPYSRSLLRFGTPIHSIGMPYAAVQGKIDVITHGIGPLTTFGNDTTFFFAKPYDYTIYAVTPHDIQLKYKFIFPQLLSLPADFLVNPVYDLKRITFIQKNKDLIYCLNNCYQIKNNLLFQASSYISYQEDNLLYNLQSGNLIAFKHILPDEMSYYLPIYDNVSSNFNDVSFAYCDGSSIYTSLSSLYLFNAKAENKDVKVKMPDELKKYFTKGSSKDNPVIVQLTPRDDL
jgi:hypothetical protein